MTFERILPPYLSRLGKLGYASLFAMVGLVLAFLILPLLAVIPLSFNSGTLLAYPLAGLSLRWYGEFFSSSAWLHSVGNSFAVATASALIATPLGTMAALGLHRAEFPFKPAILALLLSPLVIPGVVAAIGVYFFYAPLGLANSLSGLVLAHTSLALPFVLIVVNASLHGFDATLMRAAYSLGVAPLAAFRKVMLPLIAPGVITGAVLAFMTSFDETIMALFLAGPEQRTLPLQMFEGVRERISPTILAAATFLILVSTMLLGTVEWLRRRNSRMLAADPEARAPTGGNAAARA